MHFQKMKKWKKDCKIQILRGMNIESIKSNILRTFEVIKKFDFNNVDLLSTEIYEILIKNLEEQENKNFLLEKVLDLLSNESELKKY